MKSLVSASGNSGRPRCVQGGCAVRSMSPRLVKDCLEHSGGSRCNGIECCSKPDNALRFLRLPRRQRKNIRGPPADLLAGRGIDRIGLQRPDQLVQLFGRAEQAGRCDRLTVRQWPLALEQGRSGFSHEVIEGTEIGREAAEECWRVTKRRFELGECFFQLNRVRAGVSDGCARPETSGRASSRAVLPRSRDTPARRRASARSPGSACRPPPRYPLWMNT